MPEAAGGPEVREATYWCRRFGCSNHIPRRSVGIPVGWLRLTMGLPEGEAHYVTFCSPACLQATLERHPKEFQFDPKIDRRRVERAKQRKEARARAGGITRQGARKSPLIERQPVAPAGAGELAAPVVEPASVPAPPARPVCPRCGSTRLVRAYAFLWACEICGAQIKKALPGVSP
jgi:hypothetical protein